MSLVRASRALVCVCSSCGQNAITRSLSLSWPLTNQNTVTNVQDGFEGLNAGFVWDSKHGFGYNKDGEVVLVSEDFNARVSTSVPNETFPDTYTETLLNVAKESYKSNEDKTSKTSRF